MQIYLVGGAVRDQLLGLTVQERDYVVVGADAACLQALGFRPMDLAFPVFKHPDTGDEYALARRERKVGTGYKGFLVETGADVTLEEDLSRRDLTINAIAQDAHGHIIDPFQGRMDLRLGRLRHVTLAFQEDPVRLLRIARFAARFAHLGFRVAHETFALLRIMAVQAELSSVVPQRLREELLRALSTDTPWRFFTTLHSCGAMQRLLPFVAQAMGEIPLPHTQVALSSPPMAALHRATAQTTNIAVRFAALMGRITDYTGAKTCANLRLERTFMELLAWTQTWPAISVAKATPAVLLELLATLRLLHHRDRVELLTQVWCAVEPELGIIAKTKLIAAVAIAASIRIEPLKAQGLSGQALGAALHTQRLQALSAAFDMAGLP